MDKGIPGASAPSPKKDKKKQNKRPNGQFRRAVMMHLLIALGAFITAGLFLFVVVDQLVMPIMLKTGHEITAPSIVGMPIEDARHTLTERGFRFMVDSTEYNVSYPKDTIAFQYPSPGTKVKPGRRFRVIVSLGSKPVTMPDVVGKSRRDAELAIKASGLALSRLEWVHSNDYLKGIIARQEPPGGEMVAENTEVVFYISDGLPVMDLVMPPLVDLGLSAALDTLSAYGFDPDKVNIQKEEAPELLPETVIDQHPDAGTPTNTDSIVDLIVSKSN